MSTQIPQNLELIRDFVNTRELSPDGDEIAEPATLRAWLAGRHLVDPSVRVTREDVRSADAFREALRTLLLAHNEDGVETTDASRQIERTARNAALEICFHPDCTTELVPAAPGVRGALGKLAAIVADAAGSDEWSRLKACRRHSCLWAFYDHARNRSRAWCSMEVCGNREKAQKFRERHGH